MKKIILSVCMLLATITLVSAQTKGTSKISLGFEFGLPVGDFSTLFDVGVGGSLGYQKAIADKLYATGNIAYVSYSGRSTILGTHYSYNADFIPVKIGMKYYMTHNIYGSVEAGATFSAGRMNSGTAFAYSSGIGIEFPLEEKSTVDIGARYEGWSNGGTLSFFGVRAAFNFVL